MPGVYSTRFIDAAAEDGWTIYSVPEGARAVVRHVVAVNAGPAAAYLFLAVETYPVWVKQLANPYGSCNEHMRLVVNGGEQFSVYTPTGFHAIVSGYLFEDAGGGPAGISGVAEPTSEVLAPMPGLGVDGAGLEAVAVPAPDADA